MTQPSALDLLRNQGSGGDSFVFEHVGDWLDMTITGHKPQPMTNSKGVTETILIAMGYRNGGVVKGVTVAPGECSLMCGGDKGRALFKAAQGAGAADLEFGTRIVMVHTGTRPVPNQREPMKLYDVTVYERPAQQPAGAFAGMAPPPGPAPQPNYQQGGQGSPMHYGAPPAPPQYPAPGYQPPQPPQAPGGYPQTPPPPPGPPQAPPTYPGGQQVPLEWQQPTAPPAQAPAAPGYGAPQGPPEAAPLFPESWGQPPQ